MATKICLLCFALAILLVAALFIFGQIPYFTILMLILFLGMIVSSIFIKNTG